MFFAPTVLLKKQLQISLLWWLQRTLQAESFYGKFTPNLLSLFSIEQEEFLASSLKLCGGVLDFWSWKRTGRGRIKEHTCKSPYVRIPRHPEHPLLAIISPSILTLPGAQRKREWRSAFPETKMSCLIFSSISSFQRLFFDYYTLLTFFSSRKVTEKTESNSHQVPPFILFDILYTIPTNPIQLSFWNYCNSFDSI